MYKFKPEFAGASISVRAPRVTITKDNVSEEFIQKVIEGNKLLQKHFDSDEVSSSARAKRVLSSADPKPDA